MPASASRLFTIAAYPRKLLRLCEQHWQIAPAELLKATTLQPEQLAKPELLVPLQDVFALFVRAQQLSAAVANDAKAKAERAEFVEAQICVADYQAIARPPMVARDVSTLEAPIMYRRESGCCRQPRKCGIGEGGAERSRRPAAEFVGDTTLLQSLWRLACAKDLQIEVQVLDHG